MAENVLRSEWVCGLKISGVFGDITKNIVCCKGSLEEALIVNVGPLMVPWSSTAVKNILSFHTYEFHKRTYLKKIIWCNLSDIVVMIIMKNLVVLWKWNRK